MTEPECKSHKNMQLRILINRFQATFGHVFSVSIAKMDFQPMKWMPLCRFLYISFSWGISYTFDHIQMIWLECILCIHGQLKLVSFSCTWTSPPHDYDEVFFFLCVQKAAPNEYKSLKWWKSISQRLVGEPLEASKTTKYESKWIPYEYFILLGQTHKRILFIWDINGTGMDGNGTKITGMKHSKQIIHIHTQSTEIHQCPALSYTPCDERGFFFFGFFVR